MDRLGTRPAIPKRHRTLVYWSVPISWTGKKYISSVLSDGVRFLFARCSVLLPGLRSIKAQSTLFVSYLELRIGKIEL